MICGWFWLNMDWHFYSWKTYKILLNGFCSCQRLLGDHFRCKITWFGWNPVVSQGGSSSNSQLFIQGWKLEYSRREILNCFVTFKSQERGITAVFSISLGGLRCKVWLHWNELFDVVSWTYCLQSGKNPWTTVKQKVMCVGISLRRFFVFQFSLLFEANSSCYEVS